jgi:phospholipid transport system substrate-binding protein
MRYCKAYFALSSMMLLTLFICSLISNKAYSLISPSYTIGSAIEKLSGILLRSDLNQTEKRLLIIDESEQYLDFNSMAIRAMGRNWHRLSDDQKKEFVQIFKKILSKKYVFLIESLESTHIEFLSEKNDGKYAKVSIVVTIQNSATNITFSMWLKKDNWMIYDISVAGLSIINSYRAQFNRVLMNKSIEELIDKMRKITQ